MTSQLLSKACSPILIFIRHGHRVRGKAPGIAKTLQQRLARKKKYFSLKHNFIRKISERDYEDPELHKKHDIGFPLERPSRSAEVRQRLEHLKAQRKDFNLEKLARANKRKLDHKFVKD